MRRLQESVFEFSNIKICALHQNKSYNINFPNDTVQFYENFHVWKAILGRLYIVGGDLIPSLLRGDNSLIKGWYYIKLDLMHWVHREYVNVVWGILPVSS